MAKFAFSCFLLLPAPVVRAAEAPSDVLGPGYSWASICAEITKGASSRPAPKKESGYIPPWNFFCPDPKGYASLASQDQSRMAGIKGLMDSVKMPTPPPGYDASAASGTGSEDLKDLEDLKKKKRPGEEEEEGSEPEAGPRPSEEEAKEGIYGNVYGAKDAKFITAKILKKVPCQTAAKPVCWGWTTVEETVRIPLPEERTSEQVQESPALIGEGMTLATNTGGAGVRLWNGADTKVAPKSEVVMKDCRPGQTCEQQLNSGKVYQNTYHFPKEKPKPAEASVGSKGAEAPQAAEKAKPKKKNKMALIAGTLALGFFTAEVVTNVNKKGEATTVVLRGQVEAVCGKSKEKIFLKPGQMLKASADGACEEPQKIDLKKMNRFWYKIK